MSTGWIWVGRKLGLMWNFCPGNPTLATIMRQFWVKIGIFLIFFLKMSIFFVKMRKLFCPFDKEILILRTFWWKYSFPWFPHVFSQCRVTYIWLSLSMDCNVIVIHFPQGVLTFENHIKWTGKLKKSVIQFTIRRTLCGEVYTRTVIGCWLAPQYPCVHTW